jgi:glycosyltransferase involved in cell wall biosynthesis
MAFGRAKPGATGAELVSAIASRVIMARVIVLQRAIPNYRMPIYRRLADELGWQVVFGRNVPSSNLNLVDNAPFLHGVDYVPWSRRGTSRYVVPVRSILEAFKPDAIVAEGAPGMTSTWELGARRLFGGTTLLFWTIGYNPDKAHNRGSMSTAQWPYVAAYAAADALILYGNEGADFLRRYYPKKPMFVATNTIDVEELWRHRDTAEPAPRRGRPELITVGRLTTNKNLVGLVESFLAFRRHFPDAALTILGDGPERANIEAAAADQLGKSILLLGASFDEAETARFLLSADLFVMTGKVGLSVNHALAYDLPVMAFEPGANGPFQGAEFHYVIDGRTGFLVRDISTKGFAQKLAQVFAGGRDWKSELRAGIRDFVQHHLVIDRMLDGFRAADSFVEYRLRRPA